MKKKLLALVLALACTVGTLSATVAVDQPVTVEAATKKAHLLNTVYSAVRNAYGSDYLPNMRLSKDEIKERYGVKSSWYKGAIAELPMISVHADELVIIKAKNADSKKKIKNALLAYQKKLKNDTMQYPQNQLKFQGSRVFVKGSYVCFFVLGNISDEQKYQEDESKVIAAYKKENQKAVDAINKLYK